MSPAYDPATWPRAVAIALAYAAAVAGIGGWALRALVGGRWPLLARTPFSAAAWSFTFGQGAVGVLWLLTLLAIDIRRGLGPKDTLIVDISALYWHFVDVVWIAIFTLVYLIR